MISDRLLLCGELVRRGAVLADVGTDHAYLPIHLLSCGTISRCIVSDINEGPLMRARRNLEDSGYSDRAVVVLTDGAAALRDMGATDYAVCGMGGELIARIISEAPQLSDEKINLILQPMSRPEALRAYLFDNGFSILNERYVTDTGRHYVCILASYRGIKTEYTSADIHFGKAEFFVGELPLAMRLYMEEREAALVKLIHGKRLGGSPTAAEEELLSSLRNRLKGM